MFLYLYKTYFVVDTSVFILGKDVAALMVFLLRPRDDVL